MKFEPIERDIIPLLSENISYLLKKLIINNNENIEEIRLRADKPLMIFKNGKDYFISEKGSCCEDNENINNMFFINKSDIERTLQLMCDFSIYAIEEELKQGYLTLRGGHRVGIVGRAVIEGNNVRTLRNISGMNIRIAREIKGCGHNLASNIFQNGLKHTLIISPPGCGKTTLLRDVIRIVSNGDDSLKLRGHKIGIVDERSEIASCYMGIPQMDVGIRTDVLDACPKVQGMTMLLRSMSPEVIAVDEIGSLDDASAIETCVNCGVKVIATAHGNNLEDLNKRPGIRELLTKGSFETLVILSRQNGPGTIEQIIQF